MEPELSVAGRAVGRIGHPQDMATAVALLEEQPTETIVGPGVAFDEVPERLRAGTGNLPGVKQWVDLCD